MAPNAGRLQDIATFLGYFAASVAVMANLWQAPTRRISGDNLLDQTFFEWIFVHAAKAITEPHNPFATTLLNFPDGVNLMANTSMLAISIPLAPITFWLGPAVSLLLTLTFGLALTSTSWYLFCSRYLGLRRSAAALCGLFCGFAPPIIAHSNANPNIISQFMVPVLVWRALELRHAGRTLRNGAILGLCVVVQAFINEEILLMTAAGIAIFLLALAMRPDQWRRAGEVVAPMLKGLAVAAGISGVLLAYPLWHQFTGPGSYSELPKVVHEFRSDLLSYFTFARRSLAGNPDEVQYSINAIDQNSYFGPVLVLLCLGLVIWRRRQSVVVALGVTGAVCALFSLGDSLHIRNVDTGIPLPWLLFERLPLLGSILPSRWGFVVVPVIGLLVAFGLHEVGRRMSTATRRARRIWVVATVAVCAAAFIPIAPTPLPAADRTPVPAFIAEGHWRGYVANGQSIVVAPPFRLTRIPASRPVGGLTAMDWSTSQWHEFAVADGYFIGRHPLSASREALYGELYTETSDLIWHAWEFDARPVVTDHQRREAWKYFVARNASIVVLPIGVRNERTVRVTLEDLLGPPKFTGGVWLWDVRDARQRAAGIAEVNEADRA